MKLEKIKKLSIAFSLFLILMMVSCTHSDKSVLYIQKFNIINKQLDSISDKFTLDILEKEKILNQKNSRTDVGIKITPLLILKVNDNRTLFSFTFEEDITLSDYIAYNNYRIMGFIDNKLNRSIILLADSQLKTYEIDHFFQFICPLNGEKEFDSVYYPRLSYKAEYETDSVSTFYGNPPIISDRLSSTFEYKNDQIVKY